jgi:hypothetical protein
MVPCNECDGCGGGGSKCLVMPRREAGRLWNSGHREHARAEKQQAGGAQNLRAHPDCWLGPQIIIPTSTTITNACLPPGLSYSVLGAALLALSHSSHSSREACSIKPPSESANNLACSTCTVPSTRNRSKTKGVTNAAQPSLLITPPPY